MYFRVKLRNKQTIIVNANWRRVGDQTHWYCESVHFECGDLYWTGGEIEHATTPLGCVLHVLWKLDLADWQIRSIKRVYRGG